MELKSPRFEETEILAGGWGGGGGGICGCIR